ncbi:hypothetical protein FD754_003211, partial [Muntiacus muntjak]
SVILPVHDAEPWLDECLGSVLQQDFEGSMELSIFNDASKDDVMMPQRVRLQHEAALRHPKSIIGCQVTREPPNSTERYTRWINQLAPDQLLTQGGGVVRVDQSLLLYRYHPSAATHSVLETTIWAHRVRFLEERALPHWATFTIWNAGRQGRRLYRSLTAGSRRKVAAFCDVDENKIRKGFYCYEDSQERPKPRIPVLHFRAARPPFVICVKLEGGLHGGHLQPGPGCQGGGGAP